MGCSETKTDDWIEYRILVLKELERHENNLEALREKQQDTRNSVTQIETKIYMVSLFISIVVPILVTIFLKYY